MVEEGATGSALEIRVRSPDIQRVKPLLLTVGKGQLRWLGASPRDTPWLPRAQLEGDPGVDIYVSRLA